jgi:hypothetical protein
MPLRDPEPPPDSEPVREPIDPPPDGDQPPKS